MPASHGLRGSTQFSIFVDNPSAIVSHPCCSLNDRVIEWLSFQANFPQEYEASPRALVEISSSHIRQKRRRSSMSRTASPGKRRRLSSPALDQPQTPLAKPSFYDSDRTPRPDLAQGSTFMETTILQRRSESQHFANPLASVSNSIASVSSTRSSRSASPVKKLADLELSNTPVQLLDFGDTSYPMPKEAEELCFEIRRIEAQRKFCPRSIAKVALPMVRALGFDEVPIMDANDGDSDETAARDMAQWEQVKRILEAAKECSNMSLSEHSWNAEVHSRVLRISLESQQDTNNVWYCDISTARISDGSLLPTQGSGSSRKLISSTALDYGIIMAPSEIFSSKIKQCLVMEGKTSINSCDAEYIKYRPIAIGIETKRSAIEEDRADVQTGIWLSAHYERLRQMDAILPLPILPHVIIQGHDWKLRVAHADRTRRVTIWRSMRLGSTENVLGIYQLMASIQRLAVWVDAEYRPALEHRLRRTDLAG